MKNSKFAISAVSFAVSIVLFVVPFIFILLTASKSASDAAMLTFTLPTEWHLWDNFLAVIKAKDYMLVLAYFNSIVITVGSMILLVLTSALIGYVVQRRASRTSNIIYALILAGLMIPPAVVPTIWLLQELHLYKKIYGMILIQWAYGLSFCTLLFRSFVASIPRDLDEAALLDGASPFQVFFRIIFPLLKPVTVTVILVQSVNIFNDFTNPLYYLPGKENVTVQLTLFNFQSQFTSELNLLFMNILLVTLPPLVAFVFFNKQIVAGMTAGAVKG